MWAARLKTKQVKALTKGVHGEHLKDICDQEDWIKNGQESLNNSRAHFPQLRGRGFKSGWGRGLGYLLFSFCTELWSLAEVQCIFLKLKWKHTAQLEAKQALCAQNCQNKLLT